MTILLEYMNGDLQCVNSHFLENPSLQNSIQRNILQHGLRILDISENQDISASEFLSRLACAAATVKR
jgi:hypothetical protein